MKLSVFAAMAAAAALIGVTASGDGLSSPSARAQAGAGPTSGRVDNFQLVDQDLFAHELYRLADAPAVVIITQENGCPVCRNMAPSLRELEKAYRPKGVEFLMLNSNLQDSRQAILEEAKEYGFDLPILMDTNQLVGEQLGVTRTAEVFVIDPKTWKIVYHGPLDDRITYERQKEKPSETWAADALDALLAGQTPKVASHPGIGCIVEFPERDKAQTWSQISYSRQIAPILEHKCVACHQEGGIGPFAMQNYAMVRGHAKMIREVLRVNRMPPWRADPHVGTFDRDMSLTPAQIRTIVHWVEAGAPRGEGPDPLGAVEHRAPEWPLGKPDLVLDIPAFTIPASGIVDYQRPVVLNPEKEGKWLRASTIKVEQRQGVHHFLTGYLDEIPKDGEALESRWGVSVGGYAVGAESMIAPRDAGAYIPPGGAIGFQAHYTPFGKEATDHSKIALYFYDKKPKLVMRNVAIADVTISIPPNEPMHREVAYLKFPKDAWLYSAFPHAHYRGAASYLSLRSPDGTEKLLLALPKYDFNWQRSYDFAQPIKVPAGSMLVARYIYDNTKRNPANPDPNRTVPWGDQSFDEMLYTSIRYRWADETSDNMKPEYDKLLLADRLFGMLDDNLDGKLSKDELRGKSGERMKAAFAFIDTNHDGFIDEAEFHAVAARFPSRRGGGPVTSAPPVASK
jgi:thiol-disulfide isomerase/thioredoxin